VVRLENDPNPEAGGPFAELLRLQADFHTRLTTETLRYLRLLQGAFAPAAPGTVVMPDAEGGLQTSGAAGTTVQLRLEVENRQRAHCVVTPVLAPLVNTSGATWFPAAEASPPSALLPPGGVTTLQIAVPLPPALPVGTYRGVLILQGFRNGGTSVVVTVSPAPSNGARRPRRPTARATRTRRAPRTGGRR
jgi:hypothetical protein